MSVTSRDEVLSSLMGTHPDFPKKGIIFRDFMPLFRDPVALERLINHFVHHVFTSTLVRTGEKKVDVVIGLDARGFLLGPLIALRLGAAFVPVRKAGKLPGELVTAEYSKEYGTDSFAMQADSLKPGQTAIIVDDLIATGGSAACAGELVRKLGGRTLEYLFVIELDGLNGGSNLDAPFYSLVNAPA